MLHGTNVAFGIPMRIMAQLPGLVVTVCPARHTTYRLLVESTIITVIVTVTVIDIDPYHQYYATITDGL